MVKKHPITIVLEKTTHEKLAKMANQESRPIAQMARVIIERAVKETK